MNDTIFNEANLKKRQLIDVGFGGTSETFGLVFTLPFMPALQLWKMSNPRKYIKSKNEEDVFYVTVTQF